jgi:hypothetical protein
VSAFELVVGLRYLCEHGTSMDMNTSVTLDLVVLPKRRMTNNPQRYSRKCVCRSEKPSAHRLRVQIPRCLVKELPVERSRKKSIRSKDRRRKWNETLACKLSLLVFQESKINWNTAPYFLLLYSITSQQNPSSRYAGDLMSLWLLLCRFPSL